MSGALITCLAGNLYLVSVDGLMQLTSLASHTLRIRTILTTTSFPGVHQGNYYSISYIAPVNNSYISDVVSMPLKNYNNNDKSSKKNTKTLGKISLLSTLRDSNV